VQRVGPRRGVFEATRTQAVYDRRMRRPTRPWLVGLLVGILSGGFPSIGHLSIAQPSIAQSSIAQSSIAQSSIAQSSIAQSSIAQSRIGQRSSGLLSSVASAQDVDPARAAAEAFREGSVAADDLRWHDAERAFARAFELSGLPQALYMQGVALRALDRPVEARDTLRRVVALLDRDAAARTENADILAEARALADQSEARIARLEIGPLSPDVILRVDGRVHRATNGRAEIEVDPGTRSVVVEREGHETFVWSGEATPGARTTVEVVQPPIAVEAPSRRRRRAIVATLVGVVLVGAAVPLGLRLSRPPDRVTPQYPERVFEVP